MGEAVSTIVILSRRDVSDKICQRFGLRSKINFRSNIDSHLLSSLRRFSEFQTFHSGHAYKLLASCAGLLAPILGFGTFQNGIVPKLILWKFRPWRRGSDDSGSSVGALAQDFWKVFLVRLQSRALITQWSGFILIYIDLCKQSIKIYANSL